MPGSKRPTQLYKSILEINREMNELKRKIKKKKEKIKIQKQMERNPSRVIHT
jgi:hypothetical protein